MTEMLSKRQIFDTVEAHLLKQNARSVAELDGETGESCAYRGDNGRMCAAGVLIKDEFYNKRLENLVVSDANVSRALINSGVDMTDADICHMVSYLQMIHDDHDPKRWATSLTEARRRNIDEK